MAAASIHHIRKLIAEGEHQKLDFKFEISDSAKIARTLVAFANTDGGRLLVGVKDNGVIAGIRSEEEQYMAEGAARLHCRPEVPIAAREWEVEGRTVLEIMVGPSERKPHRAKDLHGHWKAYIRQGDQNFIANPVTLQVWKRQQEPSGTLVRFRDEEKLLLEYLSRRGVISQEKFQRIAGIGRTRSETILVNFIMLGILRMAYEGEHVYYYIR